MANCIIKKNSYASKTFNLHFEIEVFKTFATFCSGIHNENIKRQFLNISGLKILSRKDLKLMDKLYSQSGRSLKLIDRHSS